jgi:predicted transcriptional regulator of viral defense system
MQTLTEAVFRLNPPGGLFDTTVVQNLFQRASPGARKLLVHRAVRAGEVIRLTPGKFCLGPPFCRIPAHPFVVASFLHGPSHVSLESALWHYGLIPEAIHHVASVTNHRSRTLGTPLGRFEFIRVPATRPRAGVTAARMDGTFWAWIASPLRTIADLIYVRHAVRWESDGIEFLTNSLRIDMEEIREMPLDDLDEICASIGNRRTTDYLVGLAKELSP